MEDEHWHYVLKSLASHFGRQGDVVQKNVLVNSKMQWKEAGNIRHNAAIRTGIYLALSPLRWAAGLFKRKLNPYLPYQVEALSAKPSITPF